MIRGYRSLSVSGGSLKARPIGSAVTRNAVNCRVSTFISIHSSPLFSLLQRRLSISARQRSTGRRVSDLVILRATLRSRYDWTPRRSGWLSFHRPSTANHGFRTQYLRARVVSFSSLRRPLRERDERLRALARPNDAARGRR